MEEEFILMNLFKYKRWRAYYKEWLWNNSNRQEQTRQQTRTDSSHVFTRSGKVRNGEER